MTSVVETGCRSPQLRAEVEAALGALFDRHAAAAPSYGPEFADLWSRVAHHAQGGKLIRPMLLVEAYDALRPAAGPDRSEVVRIATGVEALHFAFLLHDDVIDGDLVRRGRPNLIGDLAASTGESSRGSRPRLWAEAGGILAGDLLISAAHQQFARADVPHPTRLRLLDLLEHTIIETAAGEFADVGLNAGVIPTDLQTVLAMTTRKTASYSFQLPLRAAAILADCPAPVEDALSAAGSHLGLAYQLQDDLLSAFGDPRRHGKDPYSDIREGKQTAIVCFAKMTSAWSSIEAHFGDPDLSADAGRLVRSLLADCGAERFARDLVSDQLAAFHRVVDGDAAPLPAEVRDVLMGLAAQLEERES